MTSWVRLWPLLCLPVVLVALFSGLPTGVLHGHYLGGGPVRQWVLNQALTALPYRWGTQVVVWDQHASILQEWLLTLWVGINLNAVLLPALFAIGSVWIRVASWMARVDLGQKRAGLRSRH